MFAVIFAFALIATHVIAEIPSYIHVCGRKDPNVELCIKDNINNLKSKICEGIPELDIPSNDPLVLDNLVISDTPNNKLYMKDVQVLGLCNFTINSLDADLEKLHFDAKLSFRHIQMNGTYDFDIRILVPIAHKGNIYISTDNIDAQVNLDFKIITKGGTKHVYLSKIKLDIDIKGYNAKYDLNERELNQLREIISDFIGNNQKEIIKSFKPALEEAISKRIIMVTNDIVKHFTYEELFPDRI